MLRFYALLLPLALCAVPTALAQPLTSGGGSFVPPAEAAISESERAAIWEQIHANRTDLIAAGVLAATPLRVTVELDWPLRQADGFDDYGVHGISNFVDQNPAFPNQIGDYNCGARTYDQSNGYNHAGTDYFTWPFGWEKMDTDAVEIVAAAPGTIVFKSDGHFDRSCELNGQQWNAVYVEHEDGSVAWYGHMKNGSTTPKSVGETVVAGEYLGVVGSSGNSSGPHLHLEVYDADETLIDPYEGACNELNPDTWWADQRPYYDSAINALMTHSAPPVVFLECPETHEVINAADTFDPGDTAYFAAYYRDQLQGQLAQLRLYQPSGAVWAEWTFASDAEHYAAAYWYWTYTMPDLPGTWTFEVEYEGETYTHEFTIGTVTASEADAAPRGFGLSAVYPNPASGSVHVALTLAEPQPVRVALYDVLGREVAVLHDGLLATDADLTVTTAGLPSGLYVVRAVGVEARAARSVVVQR